MDFVSQTNCKVANCKVRLLRVLQELFIARSMQKFSKQSLRSIKDTK